jgi:hypothetical protein
MGYDGFVSGLGSGWKLLQSQLKESGRGHSGIAGQRDDFAGGSFFWAWWRLMLP